MRTVLEKWERDLPGGTLAMPAEAVPAGEVRQVRSGPPHSKQTCNFASSRASVPMLVELRVAMSSSTWKGTVLMVDRIKERQGTTVEAHPCRDAGSGIIR